MKVPPSDESNECGDCLNEITIVFLDGMPALMDVHTHCDMQANHGGEFHESIFEDGPKLRWSRT